MRTDRVIISLSRGGADAVVAREFDLDKKAFVPAAEGNPNPNPNPNPEP